MIEQIRDIASLTPLHWSLAYTGLIVHILMKLAKVKGSMRKAMNRQFILTTLTSFLLIPVLLVICTDTSMKDLLPINYVTAFLAGYQTQDTVMIVSQFTQRSSPKSNDDETN